LLRKRWVSPFLRVHLSASIQSFSRDVRAAPCKLGQAEGTCDRLQISRLERLQHELGTRLYKFLRMHLCIYTEMKQKRRLHSASMGR